MTTRRIPVLLATVLFAFSAFPAQAGSAEAQRNLEEGPTPPEPDPSDCCRCKCASDAASLGSIRAGIALGRTSAEHEGFDVSALVYAREPSPALYTPRVLYVGTPCYFRHLSNGRHRDGVTPSGYTFGRRGDEKLVFSFAEGESVAQARPGENADVSATLRLLAADGTTPTSADPHFADLETGTGETWRFAVKTTESHVLGEFVSWTTSRGVTLGKAALGLDVVYDADGRVRQILTPSRLAVVETLDDGFSVTAYPLADVPAFDAATGLYAVPEGAEPARAMTVSHDGDVGNHRRARVTVRRGAGTPLAYVYDRTDRDWEMTRPDGTRVRRETAFAADGSARVTVGEYAADGRTRLKRTVWHYDRNPWGYSLRLGEEGWGGCARTNAYAVVAEGAARGRRLSRLSPSGLLETRSHDGAGRLAAVTARKADGTGDVKVSAYSYASNVVYDVVSPGDTRPRMETVSWNGVETERTYYVYSAATQIVERAVAGSAFGAPGNRRTTQIYNSEGRIAKSIAPDGVETSYTYSTDPVTGVFTTTATTADRRTVTVTAPNGYVLETRTEALSEGGTGWIVIARQTYTRNPEGKAIRTEDLAGRVTTAVWDCCNKVSETAPDGTTTLYTYDIDRREIARGVLTATDLTNGTFVTRCTAYDALGRVAATWTTNTTERVGLPRRTYGYDRLGRRVRTTDERGNDTTVAYSADGLVTTTTYPTGLTSVRTTDVFGRTVSVTGTAAVEKYCSYSVSAGGFSTEETRYGSPDGARFVRTVRNSLGDTIAEERPAFGGGVLATTNEYDMAGRVVHAIVTGSPRTDYFHDIHGSVTNTVRTADGTWRASGSRTSYARLAKPAGGIPAGTSVRIDERTASCSDATIAVLSQRTLTQLDGFAQGEVSRSVAFDVRGNATERVSTLDSGTGVVTTETIRPEATNRALDLSRYGASLMTVSLSSVTNNVANDALGRPAATTDGRGNTTTYGYGDLGDREAVTDAAGNTTRYAYDPFGRLAAVTNALGVVTVYEYDARGNRTYEGGATYPVRYAYDLFGNKVSMTTYRDEASGAGDTTRWLYDEATGLVTNKIYADGMGPRYEYDANGRIVERTWARGVTTTYGYDGWGNLTNTVYSDDTPDISQTYDALGRKVAVTDAAGTISFAYDDYGSLTNETWGDLGNRKLTRHWDAYGRIAGYSVNGTRKTTLGYDVATGRLVTMNEGGSFSWQYLPGTDLKSKVTYPNGVTIDYAYEPQRDLLTGVTNHLGDTVYSSHAYENDALGRRAARNDEHYRYNDRSELTSAIGSGAYSYEYDDIGNRVASTEPSNILTYVANQLNQYASVSNVVGGAFTPVYDADGNQTRVKTSTGIWSVTYNGENRPVCWSNGMTVVTMDFDSMGRRTFYREMSNGTQTTFTRFFYDGYLMIHQLYSNAPYNVYKEFVWDPTEPIATKPLCFRQDGQTATFLAHDGNKNVTDVIRVGPYNDSVGHYDYALFGAVRSQTGTRASANPYRFSSEFSDDTLSLVYYNYRHYEPATGRWLTRDMHVGSAHLYSYVENACIDYYDELGLTKRGSRNANRDNVSGHRSRKNGNKWQKHTGANSHGGHWNKNFTYHDRRGKPYNPMKKGCVDSRLLSRFSAVEIGVLVGDIALSALEDVGWFDETVDWSYEVSGELCCEEPFKPRLVGLTITLRTGMAEIDGPIWGAFTPTVTAHYEFEKSISLEFACCCDGKTKNRIMTVKSRETPVVDTWAWGIGGSAEGVAVWTQITMKQECDK